MILVRSVGLLVALCWARIAAADYVNGASDEVRAAEAVLIGHAQTAAEAGAWPAPAGTQRILVDEVLVGVWFEQTALVAAPIAPGSRVVIVVRPRDLGGQPEVSVESPPARQPPLVWPLGAGDTLPADLAADGADDGVIGMHRHGLTLTDLRAIAAHTKPGELGLTARVITAALLHPTPDPVAAIYDVDRDVPTLAALLESRSADLRAAAQARLRALTSNEIAGPARTGPAELAAWHQRWLDWWLAHRDAHLGARNYPPVPTPLAAPKLQTATALLAVLDNSPAKLAAAMRDWLDSGVVRDRDLRGMTADEHASAWPGADIAGLSYAGETSFGSIAEILDRKLPAKQRLAALAERVLHVHAERFAAERALAARQLATHPPCADRVRAAAYWEPDAAYRRGPAPVALLRLAACDQPRAIALLELMYRLRPDDAVIAAVAVRVAAKDVPFAQRLAAHVRGAGAAADWAVSILDANGYDKLTVPIALGWLRSSSGELRMHGADALERAGAAGAEPSLIAALAHETDDRARRAELSALAGVADQRALDPLLRAAKSAAKQDRLAIANGLGRIRDPRALDVLARFALEAGADEQQTAQEAVHSFCWISSRCPATPPSSPGGAVDPAYIKAGRDVIRAWQKPKPPPPKM